MSLSLISEFANTSNKYIKLNVTSDQINDKEHIKNSIYVYAKKGDTINLPLTISSFKNTDEYLLFLTLDYKQVLLDDKLNYKYFNLNNESSVNDTISIKVPNEKGHYQLTGFWY